MARMGCWQWHAIEVRDGRVSSIDELLDRAGAAINSGDRPSALAPVDGRDKGLRSGTIWLTRSVVVAVSSVAPACSRRLTHSSESVSPPVVGMRFGYTRVSAVAQTLHHQHDSLKPAGASKMYSDTMSGARDFWRP